ncbi:putative polyketide synthase [Hypoxylon sp. FL0543]|nr:putative polyketide synthase [Hypoxylon sp. FL0543]
MDGPKSNSIPSMNGDTYRDNEAVRQQQELIAIVGMGWRLPGDSADTEKLWQLLLNGQSGHGPVPPSRYNAAAFYHPHRERPASINSDSGYFLNEDPRDFENGFFGISNVEAICMDPLQRKLLEVVFECFESAGATLEELSGKDVGCYVGNFGNDYPMMQLADMEHVNRYTASGATPTLLANRISHVFNLRGPSFVIDTGCSSSLHSLHSACVALDLRECDGAVVAGASLIQMPQQQILAAKTGIISNSATCRTFDASADGYGRAEGVGALYLKRLDDAIRDGDPIRGVIRGTAINSNGKTPGVMQPSSDGQERVMRQAYARAGLSVEGTDYVEAHGTGTPVGDPIEVDAISRVFSRKFRRPIFIGSVKTNLGHSEGTSGITSVIKVILAMENRIIPPTINLSSVNPKLSNPEFNVEIVREAIPWPETPLPRASVNSFGFGGANSHAIIEAYSGAAFQPQDHVMANGSGSNNTRSLDRTFLIPVSAHGTFSLNKRIEGLQKLRLPSIGSKMGQIAYTMANRRCRLQHRAYLLTGQKDSHSQLDIRYISQPTQAASAPIPPITFVCTGQGAQWTNMGHKLFTTYKVFRQSIERQDSYLEPHRKESSWTLVRMLSVYPPEHLASVNVNQPNVSQVFCTAIQIALIDLLAEWHIRPSTVIGHSSGEIAAAYAAGFISCREAILLAYYRGIAVSMRKDQSDARPGAMVGVGIGPEHGLACIQQLGLAGQVDLACVNSPKNITMSGDREAIGIFKDEMDRLSIFNRVLRTDSVAYHSHHMRSGVGKLYEKMITELLVPESGSGTTNGKGARVSMISTVKGCVLSRQQARLPSYWRENLENTVLFNKALKELFASENSYVVEIGPHPALQTAIKENRSFISGSRSAQLDEARYSYTLVRNKDDVRCMFDLAGSLFNHGYEVCFDAINKLESSEKRVVTSLPKYVWDYKNTPPWKEPRISAELRNRCYSRHELLGLQIPGGSRLTLVWRNVISINDVPWLGDHRFRSTILFPAAGFISMVIEAACQAERLLPSDRPNIFLREMKLFKTLPLPDDGNAVEIFTELRRLPISGSTDSKEWWQINIGTVVEGQHVSHVAGRVSCQKGAKANTKLIARRRLSFADETMEPSAVRKWYRRFTEAGIDGGPHFKVIQEVYTDRMKRRLEAHSKIRMHRGGPNFGVGGHEYVAHPTIIDGMLQTGFIAAAAGNTAKVLCLVPSAIEAIDVITSSAAHFDDDNHGENLWSARSSATKTGFAVTMTDSELHNPKGEVLLRICKTRNTLYQGVSNTESKEPRDPNLRVCWKPDITFLDSRQGGELLSRLAPAKEGRSHSIGTEGDDCVKMAEYLDLIVHKRPNKKIALLNMTQHAIEECMRVLEPNKHFKCFAEVRCGQLDGDVILDMGDLTELASCPADNKPLTLSDYDLIVADCAEVPDLLEVLYTSTSSQTDLVISFRKDSVCPAQIWKTAAVSIDIGPASDSSKVVSIIQQHTQAPVVSGEIYIVGFEAESILNRAVYQRFKQEPNANVQFLPFSQIGNSSIPSGSSLILTIEGEGQPILEQVGANDLQRLQTITSSASRLLWITRGDLLRAKRPENVLAWGAARAIRLEEPQLRLATFDFDGLSDIALTASHVFAVFQSTFAAGPVDLEYIEYEGVVHVSRLVPDETLNRAFKEKLDMRPSKAQFKDAGPVELSIKAPGQLDMLGFKRQQNPFRSLISDEVEVEAKCYGMNAKDLYLLNDKFDVPSPSCSLEFAGVVRRVGPATKSLRVGDRVVVMAIGRYRNLDIVPEWCCAKLLPTEDFESACTLLLCFTTALYAIKHLTRLRSGESILIHSASGGVGQAAIQLARRAGATVFATAGSQEKRDWLSKTFEIPSTHIFSSRDSSFLPAILDATDQRGVDVVINSLSGELLHASAKALAPLGRFVEIGKKDIFDSGRLDLASIGRSGSFIVLDILELVASGRQWGRDVFVSLIEETMQLYRERAIQTIHPRTVFDVSDITRAFRYFSQPARIGKVVVSMENRNQAVKLFPETYATTFDSKKTYLMIGGFGGIGITIARWMVSQGARNFVFLSRSGASKSSAANLVADLQSKKCEVHVVKGDVSNLNDVQSAFDKAPSKIGGIVHTSMAVRATHWRSLTCEDWHYGIAAKVKGTRNLHQVLATEDERDGAERSLDFFLLLSSLSGTIGSPTEPGYCAANAYMDSFARFRRAQGLKAISLALGVITEVGYIHEHPGMETIYTRRGLQPINEDELLQLIDLAIANPGDDARLAYDTLMRAHILTGLEMQAAKARTTDLSSTVFDTLFQDPRAGLLKMSWDRDMGSAGDAVSLSRTELPQDIMTAVANGDTFESAVGKALLTKFSNIIMLPSGQLRLDQPLASFGLDSMLAAEFRGFIFQSMQVDIPFESLLSQQVTISSITAVVVEQIQGRQGTERTK